MYNLDNAGRHIYKVVDNHPCDPHDKAIGEPCYAIPTANGDLTGVCGRRITKQFDGKISARSLPSKKF